MQFDWIAFYKEIAHKLLLNKDKWQQLVEYVKTIYAVTGINLPTLER